jgi:zinc protease
MFRIRIAAALCAVLVPMVALAAAAPAKKTAGDVLPFKAAEKTFPNGLKVIVVPTGFPNIVAIQIPVQTGSRNEVEPGKSGFAHFFEHMMSRGTPTYPPEKYNEVVTKAGARENANTSDDRTIYHITFAKEDLPKIMEIYADRFMHLAYEEPAFKTEANAVLGEYNKNSASPVRKLIEVQRDAAYTTHTYKHTTMGFIKDIEDMPNQYAYSKEFFKRWYRPEYTTIIVAGDVKADEVFKLVDQYWSKWERGSYKAEIPAEPPSTKPVYAHVPWSSQTPPWVTVAFRGPAFSETKKDSAAITTLLDLEFGQTSDLYKKLVQDEQKVDQLFNFDGENVDPGLYTVLARVKKMDDVVYVRDQILATLAKTRSKLVPAQLLADAKSNNRYSLVRSLDNSEAVAQLLAEYGKFNRSFNTINNYYRVEASLTPKDLQDAAKTYVKDENLVVTTLSKDPMPAAISSLPKLASFSANPPMASASEETPSPGAVRVVSQKSIVPQVEVKLLFNSGSAADPAGKEGLARLAASMVTNAGSKAMTLTEIQKALYPMAGVFFGQVDKDMTTMTASIHRDNWKKFLDIVLPQLLQPGFRQEDFTRIRDAQLNALTQNLRNNNEEELGKEQLINRIYGGTPYGHTVLGTVAGLNSITLDDVKSFVADHYTRGNLVIGISGDYPDAMLTAVKGDVAKLPPGTAAAGGAKSLPPIAGRKADGLNVEIIQKETRATAISIGAPLPITRAAGADWAALNVARAWLGEHRMSQGRLFQRLREIRGLNYGDYAYIEFFTNPGGQFFPSPNVARRSQAFEVWIRPVVPANAHMSLRIALYELNKLVNEGLSEDDFQNSRQYLMKNAYVMTSTQDQQLGYALDAWWYGTPEYTSYVRGLYSTLTRDDVNAALKKYLDPKNLQVVIVTKDAEGLKNALLGDGLSSIAYESPKPAAIMEEDKVIGAWKLNIKPENLTVTPVENVFAQ